MGGLTAADDAPQFVVADRVAAVELTDPVQLVIVRGLTLPMTRRRPCRAANRTDRQRAELIKRETPIGERVHDLFDTVQLGVTIGIIGFFPRLGPLERDVMLDQDLAAPFPPDHHDPFVVVSEIADRLDIPLLRTMFGTKQRPRTPGGLSPRVAAVIETPWYNLTIFKVHFGALTLKGYTKGEHVLRSKRSPTTLAPSTPAESWTVSVISSNGSTGCSTSSAPHSTAPMSASSPTASSTNCTNHQ